MLNSITTYDTLPINNQQLYVEFVRRHQRSKDTAIRNSAIKCAIVYALKYKPLTKEVFNVLHAQLIHHHNARIWTTAITGFFDLFSKHGTSYSVLHII